MISVQGLEKRYGTLRALADVDFKINQGEVVGLLGQNGAGKTTCMKILTGYLEPTAGSVSIGGVEISRHLREAQAQIGYLPEHNPLYLEMTVEEYLCFMAELRNIDKNIRQKAIHDALEVTGLIARRHQTIQILSKGYRQRVGLAQAILHKPKILILDEPTNGLDPLQIQEIRTLIKKLAHNTTILLSTHILSEIEAVCDRVLILIDGKLAADNSLTELLYRPEIRISVSGGEPDLVLSCLSKIEGVSEVSVINPITTESALEPENTIPDSTNKQFVSYLVRCTSNQETLTESFQLQSNHEYVLQIAPRIARIVIDQGWELGELTPHIQSLESAFKALQTEYITHLS